MASFVAEVNSDFAPDIDKNESVFKNVWEQYENVIVQSLITSFGLDFIQDQHGGDVDTIHNVRQIGKDPKMHYKNAQNATDYAKRGAYDSRKYHQDPRYIAINRKMSENKKNGTLTDAYTGKKVARNAKMDLDHVISAKEIHDDPGRILAGTKGTDLANTKDNLKPTDRSINRSMQAKDKEEYLQTWAEKGPQRQARINELQAKSSLSDKERKELNKLEKQEEINPAKVRAEEQHARKAYDRQVAFDYYTSSKFLTATVKGAGSLGAKMGLRQAAGLVLYEVWATAKAELQSLAPGKSLKDMLEAVANGIKKGFANAKEKYREILAKFGEGFLAGALSSLTTTICNIFFTTAKNVVKSIRQIYASVVQAGKVLLFNPDNLELGERIKTTTVILATGASVLVGSAVGELIATTPIAATPIGSTVITFCSSLVSGLLSCTLLIFLDRSDFINKLIDKFYLGLQGVVADYKAAADAFEELAAELSQIDIASFRAETARYQQLALKIEDAKSEAELNTILLAAYKTFDIKIPWKGDFDSFMGDRSNHLVFE
ncbi:hypothetical protein [Ligilactobacillus agilis]|uniref:hypothetical protein n=1 Tax=Ligilactobacillus agilis TaxID=1601 RepID=UPI0022E3ACF9|nr:hypothetical protein [Ligilactobacillus agilis]